ncbi:MAG: host specificity factor TipJ family phage tail protein [Halomonas sp.]|uniref:host specificity factor TipJ family phage tail protein n=1 Tax=Halomonas sp. TaxID=1486246 RepID=UPI003F912CBF
MTVNVYPSTLPGEPIEQHQVSGITLEQWLRENAPGCIEGKGEARPISAAINGQLIPPAEWGELMLRHGVDVDLRVQPQGLEGALLAAVIAGVVAAASAFLLKPSIPGVNSGESSQGARLLEASAQGNQPKLGEVIPDQAGRCKKTPDYLTAPVRRFVDQRSQSLYLFFSLGLGHFERNTDDLMIGSTPVNSLPGVSYQFFEPGEDVSGHPATQNWYNAPEVGASTGSSGLRLRGVSVENAEYQGASKTEGAALFINSELPSSWMGDIRLVVNLLQSITVGSNRTSFFGDFRHLSAGVLVTIQGTILAGIYRVRSVTSGGMLLEDLNSGALLSNFPPGEYSVYIDRTGANYGVAERIEDRRGVVMQRYLSDGAIDSTWSAFPEIELTQVIVRPSDATPASLWTGPFAATPSSEKTTTIQWDIFCPNGLGYIEDDGTISERSVDVELEWSDPNGGSGSIVKTVTGATRDQIGWTFEADIPSSSPNVRQRRLTLEDTSTQALDRVEWYGLRSLLPTNANYPGVSTLAMVISGSDLIASQTENQISIIDTRKLPVWDGSQWTSDLHATRDIAPYVRYIAHSKGYTDDDIDMPELLRLDAIWKARGDTFDFITSTSTTMKDALNTALRAGMAEITIEHGRLRPVREAPRTVPEHMYTLQNMPGELRRKFTGPRPEDPDGVDVEYLDENSRTVEVVECRLPGDQGVRPKKVRLDGVGNRDKAYQIGMRERSRMAYQRWEYEWPTELDGLNSKYKSFCALADDVPGYGRSAILLDVDQVGSNTRLLSSEPFDWEEGKSYVVAWRRPDGTLSGPYPAQRGDSDDIVISQMDEVPVIYSDMEPPHLQWGTTERWCYQAIVEDVEPNGFDSVSLKALNYDARVYAYDDAVAPP